VLSVRSVGRKQKQIAHKRVAFLYTLQGKLTNMKIYEHWDIINCESQGCRNLLQDSGICPKELRKIMKKLIDNPIQYF
jgi:hypothetical protein